MDYTLHLSSRDKAVKIFKEWLSEVLIPSPKLTLNDVFDAQMKDAVTKFQARNQIFPISGKLDPETAKEISLQVKNQQLVESAKHHIPKIRHLIEGPCPGFLHQAS